MKWSKGENLIILLYSDVMNVNWLWSGRTGFLGLGVGIMSHGWTRDAFLWDPEIAFALQTRVFTRLTVSKLENDSSILIVPNVSTNEN